MDLLSVDKLDELRTVGESRTVEYKESAGLDADDEVLRQLTAFANLHGGTLLYGICDDCTMEGASIDVEAKVERVSQLVRDKTSPIVEFIPLWYHGSDGDVLAFKVLKRRGIPCAVVDRGNHEIKTRKYFIRTSFGVRLVDDWTLEWLFSDKEDPSIQESFRACVQYNRNDISLTAWLDYPLVTTITGLVAAFQCLTDEQRDMLKSDESSNMIQFLAAVVMHAIVAQLSRLYRSSWRVQITRRGDTTSWGPLPAVSDTLSLEQLIGENRGELLERIGYDASHIYDPGPTLSLPMGASVCIDMGNGATRQAASITIKKAQAFDIRISVRGGSWSVGAAPGHPIGGALGGIRRLSEQAMVQQKLACVQLYIDVSASFAFPDEPSDEIREYRDWSQQLASEVRNQWDWDKVVDSLPPPLLYSIDRDVREVLELLRQQHE